MATLTIEGKVVGQKRPLFPEWELSLVEEENRPTLRTLITEVVNQEVQNYNERQEAGTLVRALTQSDIERGLMKGKVDSGGKEARLADPKEAVEVAIQAFEDGLYYVFVDENQITELDAELRLAPQNRVTFLRLVALAGG